MFEDLESGKTSFCEACEVEARGGKIDGFEHICAVHYSSSWTQIEDPLHYVICPHCSHTIFMSKKRTLDKLKDWAKNLIK